PGDADRDLVLQVEHIFERTVEAVRPKMRSVRRVDQLGGDAHVTPRFAHRAFEDVAHPSSRPTCFTSTGWPLYVKLELRAMATSHLIRDSAVMISSTMPSTNIPVRDRRSYWRTEAL